MDIAIKKTDLSFFRYDGSGIPMDIRDFFLVDNIYNGEKRNIILIYEDKRYSAYIHCEMSDMKRTRMFWESNLGVIFKSSFSGYDLYSSNDFPSLRFDRTAVDEYIVSFIGEKPDESEGINSNIAGMTQQHESLPILDYNTDLESVIELNGPEGKRYQHYVTKYERDPKNRIAAIRIHGTKCQVCGFDFEKAYGGYGRGFIEVHHIVPLSTMDEEVLVDPEKDLVCVCSNCHRMIHRKRNAILTIEELKSIYKMDARLNSFNR